MEPLTPHICQLEKSIFAIIGNEGATNFGIVKGEDGRALLVDADIRRIDEIEDALSRTGCAQVSYLFNTHENFDHSSANYYFEKNGTTVISSDGTWRALQEDGEAKFAEMAGRVPELWKRFPDLRMGVPQMTFGETATVRLAGVAVRLVYSAYNGQSHSRGDAVALLGEEETLLAGDLLYTEVHPVTIYGNIPNWIESINLLLKKRFKRIVPGHGPVVEGETACKEALVKFLSYLEDFYHQLSEAKSRRKSAHEVQAYMTGEKYEALGKTWMVKRNIDYFLREERG